MGFLTVEKAFTVLFLFPRMAYPRSKSTRRITLSVVFLEYKFFFFFSAIGFFLSSPVCLASLFKLWRRRLLIDSGVHESPHCHEALRIA